MNPSIRKLNVAFVSRHDPFGINNWSGLPYYMAQSFRQRVARVDFIDNLETKRFPIHYMKREFYRRLKGALYLNDRTKKVGEHYARQIQRRLSGKACDVIFCPSTMPIAYLETSIPIVFWTDATFSGMIDYYFFNICRESINDGNEMERSALTRCALAVYSSEWAGKSAVAHYGVDPWKVKVIPFGANLSKIPDIEEIDREFSSPLELLLVGRDWGRKGGPIAVEVADLLNQEGIQAHLTVVGCEPVPFTQRPYMTVYPHLDKSRDADAATLYRLFLTADFLILPSRAECTPVVFSEASAFGFKTR